MRLIAVTMICALLLLAAALGATADTTVVIRPTATPTSYRSTPPARVAVATPAAQCSGSNLLGNPSFEGEYTAWVPPGGHPDCPWGICGTAQMAAGWTPYWRSHTPGDEGWRYRMPEYKPALSIFTDPPRVRSGERAQQWFTFWSTHEAGVYQRVYNVTPGATYCLSVWGHAWSSDRDDNAYTDPNDHGFLDQFIGIDPTGGTDWRSPNIVWTAPRTQYDTYGLFKIEVAARSNTLTVFLGSHALWPKKHTDVYYDDAILARADGQWQPTATPTALPSPTPSPIPSGTPAPTATSTAVPSPTPSPTPASGIIIPLREVARVAPLAPPSEQMFMLPIQLVNTGAWTWSALITQRDAPFQPRLGRSSGNNWDALPIFVTNPGLPAGVYNATVRITSGSATPVDIAVRLIVAQDVSHGYLPVTRNR